MKIDKVLWGFIILIVLCFGLLVLSGIKTEREMEACEPTNMYTWPRGVKTRVYVCPEDVDPQN